MSFLKSLIVIGSVAIGAPDVPTTAPGPEPPRESELVAFDLKLMPGDERSLRWSPKGRKIEFDATPDADLIRRARADLDVSIIDASTARVAIGHNGVTAPAGLLSCRISEDRTEHERLILDVNRDGRFDRSEVFETEANEVRGRMWVSFGNIPIDVVEPAGERVRHRFTFWRVYPGADEPLEFDGIRLSRRSWMEGFATIEGVRYRIALIDGNNDGQYTRRDRWAIAVDDGTPASSKAAERHIAESKSAVAPIAPNFIGEQAFRLMDVNLAASKAAVRMSLDRKPIEIAPPARPKAEAGPTWKTDLEAARAEAKASGKRVLLKWTAVWCGPCKVMDREAFMDREVVGLISERFIPVQLDFDAQRKLAREMRVTAIPTVHVFAPNGDELDRHTGLLDPAPMVAFLRESLRED